ncbi:unnamed protein product [Prorocentrum cordatum]|uniref:Uncharacterized protein n=1 Tax=Prorocentrum cordatum TaxID=2364126 RepID=A0ABN9WWE8_9DINO|nr:unnamed protein product [Polarella glacialis]
MKARYVGRTNGITASTFESLHRDAALETSTIINIGNAIKPQFTNPSAKSIRLRSIASFTAESGTEMPPAGAADTNHHVRSHDVAEASSNPVQYSHQWVDSRTTGRVPSK